MELTKKETQRIIIAAFIAAFVFSFNEWGIEKFNAAIGVKNLILAFVFCLVIYFFHAIVQKLTAEFYEYKIEFTLIDLKRKIKELRRGVSIPIGPIITLLVTFISNGNFFFIILTSFEHLQKKEFRIGRRWTNIIEFEEAQIGLSGPLSQILLLIVFKILTPLSPVFQKGMFIASTIAIFNMLPIPKVDGARIFFGSLPLYITSLVFIVVFIVLIFQLSILQTLILAFIFAFVIGLVYLFKSKN